MILKIDLFYRHSEQLHCRRQRYLLAISLLANNIKALLVMHVATNRVNHAWCLVLMNRFEGSVFVGFEEFYNVILGSDSELLGAVKAELSDGAICDFDFVENLVGNARINS